MSKKINKNLLFSILAGVIAYGAILAALKTGILNRQSSALVVPVLINIILAVSLNLTTGFLGELTLGHAGFMSIGAYAGALITLKSGLPAVPGLILALVVGGLTAAVFGVIIGVPVLRLRGDYLAIVTLAFGEIIKSLINAMEITGGAKGLSKIPAYTTYKNFTLVYILTALTVILIANFVRSRHGRAITSIRDNYIAAEAVGIPVAKYKVLAFSISAFFAGIAGVIYAHNVTILKPGNFDYNKSIEILVIVVLGGMGSIKGSVIAAVILTLLPEMLRSADEFRMLLYAVVLIAMMLFNNSRLKLQIAERRAVKQAAALEKEGE